VAADQCFHPLVLRRLGASQLALLTPDQQDLLGPITSHSVPVPLHEGEQSAFGTAFGTALDPSPGATVPGYAVGEGLGNLPPATFAARVAPW